MEIEIQKGAIFIADSHAQNGRDALLGALKRLRDSRKIPPQIFFMGDIANMLVGNLKTSREKNADLIRAIEVLGESSQVFYFEGNHDFALEKILPNAQKFARDAQPVLARFGAKKGLLAHGDIFCGAKYEIYIRTLTSNAARFALNALDLASFGRIYNVLEKQISRKKLRILDSESKAQKILKSRALAYKNYLDSRNLGADFIIEGHFHLGKILDSRRILGDLSAKNFQIIALPAFFERGLVYKIGAKNFEFLA